MSITCKICGGGGELIHIGTRDRKDVNVYECCICKTKQLDKFGVNDYEKGFMNGTTDMSKKEIEVRLKSCEKDDIRRANYISPLIKDKCFLDFGCGFGGLFKQLARKNNPAKFMAGVELGSDERKYLTSLGVYCTRDIEEQNSIFDYITLFHVFEHLENPLYWLEKISFYLKENGKVIIEIPNGNDVLLSRYHCEHFADFTYWSAHLFLYTVESFKLLISKTPYFTLEKVEQVQRYPLANHLYWLTHGKPAGQIVWSDFSTDKLNKEYKKVLEKNYECDTLLFTLKKNEALEL